MNFAERYGSRPNAAAEEVFLVVDDDDDEYFTTAASTPPPRWMGRPAAAAEEDEIDNWCLSPASRAMEIARGQRELMDMIKIMPEEFYELSLKDLVDHHAQIGHELNPNRSPERNSNNEEGGGGGGEVSRPVESEKEIDNIPPAVTEAITAAPAKMKRSGSMNNGHGTGFLLKMGLPISYLRSRRKKKKVMKKNKKKGGVAVADSYGGRVSPEAAVGTGESERSSSAFSGGGGSSSESRSSKSSTSRGSWRSSSRNSIRRKSGGRWCLFFSSSKGKVVE
ncbi:hypothetical protein LINPERPRIM_LOCUS4276 [Linum perenne]